MPKDILKEIVEKRRAEIAQKGIEFGFKIPSKRSRKIHSFLETKGTILEVKRASPSKGDIAPNLNSAATALSYAKAGANAISCLTETNYFKGSLQDLMNVCTAVDKFESETKKIAPAVLRKDFLLSTQEIVVSYRAGADAVLLIARILDSSTILEMAKKCAELKITALVEVRKSDDLEKLNLIMQNVNHKYIAVGVNSRDLRNFSIDPLIPAKMFNKIKKIAPDAKIIFESGILSFQSASFAAGMNFTGILLGEAAAKNPGNSIQFTQSFKNTNANQNGKSWTDYAEILDKKEKSLPLIKICGITNIADAVFAGECGADFLGFVLYPPSSRCTNENFIREAYEVLHKKFGKNAPRLIGVVAETKSNFYKSAINLAKEGILFKVQFHGCEMPLCDQKEFYDVPRFAAVNIKNQEDVEKAKNLLLKGEPRILIDAQTPNLIGGTGKRIDENFVEQIAKSTHLWLAGGITAQNVKEIIAKFNPELLDLSSSLEKEKGIKDHKKILEFFNALKLS